MTGVIEEVQFLELCDRVLALEKSLAELAKWTHFNQGETPANNRVVDAGCGCSKNPSVSEIPTLPSLPDANVEVVAASDNLGENVETEGNQGKDLENEILMEAEDDQQKSDNPQRTFSDKTPPVAPIPERAALPSELQVQGDNDRIEKSGGESFPDQSSKDVALPHQLKIKEEVFYCKMENDRDSSEEQEVLLNSPIGADSSEPAKEAQKRHTRSSNEKSTNAIQSSSVGLKSPLKQLTGNSQIRSKNKKTLDKRPNLKCPHCPKTSDRQYALTMHIRTHTGERPFRCPHCPYATKQSGNLRTHIRAVHPQETHNLLPCKICRNKFHSRTILRRHMQKHLKCYFCSMKFKKFSALENHLATHTGEKPFSCPHCLYSSAYESNLKTHIRSQHSNAKQP